MLKIFKAVYDTRLSRISKVNKKMFHHEFRRRCIFVACSKT